MFQYKPISHFKNIIRKENLLLSDNKYEQLISLFELFIDTYKSITKDDLLNNLANNSDLNILKSYIFMETINTFESKNLPSFKYILYRLCSLINVKCLPIKVSDINVLVVDTIFSKMNI